MQLVSVIITCYKDGATLERAIISVINQKYKAVEIIVVNDFSPETDLIDSIIENYKEIVYIRNDINKGLAASRNIGIEVASGEYIAFLDADDSWHIKKIEIQYT